MSVTRVYFVRRRASFRAGSALARGSSSSGARTSSCASSPVRCTHSPRAHTSTCTTRQELARPSLSVLPTVDTVFAWLTQSLIAAVLIAGIGGFK
eukprot:785509-Pleurochrysis_carterae.AAC.2